MKINIISVVVFLSIFTGLSTAKDSVKKEWTKNSFNLSADSLYSAGDIMSARGKYYDALNEYKETGDSLGIVYCRLGLAKISFYEGYYSQAQKLLSGIDSTFLEHGLYSQYYDCRDIHGGIYLKRGQYDEAISEYRKASDEALKAGMPRYASQSLRVLGKISTERGRYVGAKMNYAEAMSVSPSASDSGFVYLGYSDVYTAEGIIDKAFAYIDSAEALASAEKDTALFVELYGSKANIYKKAGNYLKALEFYAQQLDLIKTQDDRASRAKTMMNMAAIFELQKQYAKAADFMEEVVKLLSEMNSPEAEQAKAYLKSLKRN